MNAELLLSIAALLLAIFVGFNFFAFMKKFRLLFSNSRGESLEKDLSEFLAKMDAGEAEMLKIQKQLTSHEARIGKAVSKVGVIRYNPFRETGGDLSFSSALLNEQNNGIVISSIHGREGTRIYAKPVEAGKSKYTLSEEELEAIKKASSG